MYYNKIIFYIELYINYFSLNMKTIFIVFLLIFIFFDFISCNSGRIDLSDQNPIVYCLKTIKGYTFQQVKDYILKQQDPQYALENKIHDDIFALCVEQVSKDNV